MLLTQLATPLLRNLPDNTTVATMTTVRAVINTGFACEIVKSNVVGAVGRREERKGL